jgi:5'-3' exonuclease
MTEKLLVLDGTNLLYRSFHALAGSGLSHAGRPVWAVHGLLLQIAKAVEFSSPTHLVVAFDTPGGCPTRREIDPGYKATRKSPAEELTSQLTWAPMVLRQLGMLVSEVPGWEADDIIASYVTAAEHRGIDSLIVTSDRDAYQLLSAKVSLRTPDEKFIDLASLRQGHGVDPAGYALLAALRGEPSDNLPGITGVGPKTALKIVENFASLDELESADDARLGALVGPKTLAAIRRDLHLARRTFEVARLRRDLPTDLDAARLSSLDPTRVAPLLEELGLPAAGRRLATVLRSVF